MIQNILRSVDSGIRAIAAHPKEGVPFFVENTSFFESIPLPGQLACAGYSGFIQLWNYQARKVLPKMQES